MNNLENNLVKHIKQCYLNNKLQDCLKNVEQYDKDKSSLCHLTLQLYKMLCLFELFQSNQAKQCFDKIVEEKEKVKGEKVESIDVITIVLYLHKMLCINKIQCENLSDQLFKICQQYKEQSQNTESYEEGIYLLGLGTYQFIKTIREEENLFFIADLEKAYLLLNDYKQDAMNFLYHTYFFKDKLEEAQKWSQLLYNQNPKYPAIAYNVASVHCKKKQFQKAIYFYEENEQQSPNNCFILNSLAIVYRQIGDTLKEEEYLKRAYEIQPRQAISCHKFGVFKYRQNLKEEATQLFNEGISIDPDILENYEELAQIAIENYEFDTAVNYLKKCIEICPEEGYQYYKLGDCFLNFQRYDEAIQYYQISTQKRSYQNIKIDCISSIAFCHFQLGNYTKSLEEYFNSCSINSLKYNCKSDLENICSLINYCISLRQAIQIVNKQEGKCIRKFQQIKEGVQDVNLKCLFSFKLNIFREFIQIKAYQKHIQPNITFQSQYSHLDLYLD